jgi:hypothetical protein
MSDIATTAKSARESLARGLSALQSDPSVPPHIIDLATPIAQAMSALHQIERSNGTQLVPHAQNALSNVRTALSSLQAQPTQHPAIVTAMEAVAGSLGLVHAINKLVQPGAGPAPVPAQGIAYAPTGPQAVPAGQGMYGGQPQQAPYGPPPQQQAPYGPPPQQQPAFPAPQPVQAMSPGVPAVARDPFASPGRSPMAATTAAPQGAFPLGTPTSGRPPSPPSMDGATVIAADLGAHSPSNFYKGLSGNDIIDHGGLFVSTYMIPKIGAPIRLRVSLPGGYEFEANAVVQWAREQGGDAPPGFGAKFTQITPEARQLVYRYVRNREPLFHDDL